MWTLWKKRRHVVAILAFLGFFSSYILRANLSVAIVAMTTNKTAIVDNITTIEVPEFHWDTKTRSYVLSSFFYGYLTTQVIGGWLSVKIGGKKLFGIGIGMTALLTLLTPWASRSSVYALIALRTAEGVFEGVTGPAMGAVWSKWAPPLERTRLVTVAISGCSVGTVIAMVAGAYLAEMFGWSSIFYVSGSLSLVWFVIWMWYVSETPADDRRISETELEYIEQSLGVKIRKKSTHPWKKLLTSLPVWAIIIFNFTDDWAFYTLLTQLPAYLKDRFSFNLQKVGFLSGLPFVATTIMSLVAGQMADWLQKKQMFTTTQVRKVIACGSCIGQVVFLIMAANSSSATVTVLCIILGACFEACAYSGYGVNSLDIAPQHAGLIIGIGNTAGSLAGVCAPIFAGHIVTDGSPEQWRIVFYVTSAIILYGGVMYSIFGSGEIQRWSDSAKQGSSYSLLTSDSDNDD